MAYLTFAELRHVNVERCESGVFGHVLHDWNPTDWGCALAGETGELCNLLKKQRLRRAVNPLHIEQELADVQIYLDLTAAVCGVDLAAATVSTFNAKSAEVGSSSRLVPRASPADPAACRHPAMTVLSGTGWKWCRLCGSLADPDGGTHVPRGSPVYAEPCP